MLSAAVFSGLFSNLEFKDFLTRSLTRKYLGAGRIELAIPSRPDFSERPGDLKNDFKFDNRFKVGAGINSSARRLNSGLKFGLLLGMNCFFGSCVS